MAFWLKNCGLTTVEAVLVAASTGATHIGLMHHEASVRHMTLAEGAALRERIPAHVQTVAVLVDPSNDVLDALISEWQPDMLQLHALADATRLIEINLRYGIPVILAAGINNKQDIQMATTMAEHGNASALLFDAAKAGLHGGTGETFDWDLLDHVSCGRPWFLAGGLTPENVATAIRHTHPNGVDVSSGIESSHGIKSLEKIAAFNEAVLSTPHAKR